MMKRNGRSKGGLVAPFGLSFFIFAVTPNQIGYQDVGALVARQAGVAAHWRQHIRASAFGTIHAATFSFSRPIGTAMPQPLSYQLVTLDPRVLMPSPWGEPYAGDDDPPLQFPTVNRGAKGDRQKVLNPVDREPETAKVSEQDAMTASLPAPPAESEPADAPQAVTIDPADPVEPSVEAEASPEASEAADMAPVDIPDPVDALVAESGGFPPPDGVESAVEMARLFFGNEPLGDEAPGIEKWAPGEEPIIVMPPVGSAEPAPADRDIKHSALHPAEPLDTKGGESIARKGQVTGEGQHPITPAERLKLEGKDRVKAEKCLADAVYFEARGEEVRGQIAVAQVVMNRVFSGYYPRTVCGAVYQNKHRRFSCQFTFACDGIPDVITEPHAWLRATRIAREVLDGNYWLPEVNRATHYHAYWVRPRWVREMKRLYKTGVHTFYRPRRWGDGADTPAWGTVAATSEAIAKL